MTPYRSNNLFQIILELSKVRITIAVAFTTLTGYVLARGTIDTGVVLPVAGIFLLACGSSALNHLQEKRSDTMMKRTRSRPLPSGRISKEVVIITAVVEMLAGAMILYFFVGMAQLLLGLFALLWYNIVYTNLKRKTVHAVIPGSVIGAVPPLVGWVSGGRMLIDPDAFIIALFFFIWQIPHFYLLAYKYGEDYKAAGFPSLTAKYDTFRIKRLIFYWVTLTAIVSMFIPMFEITRSYLTLFAIGILSFRLVYQFLRPLLNIEAEYDPGKYFMKVNHYVLMIVLLLIFDRILMNLI